MKATGDKTNTAIIAATPASNDELSPDWLELRGVAEPLSAAVLSPSGSFLGSLVGGLASGYAHVGGDPSDSHRVSFVLELQDLLHDVREDVRP
jgi:hypothetical protein